VIYSPTFIYGSPCRICGVSGANCNP